MAARVILFESFEKNICAALDPHFQKSGFETQLETDVDVCLESVRKAPPGVVVMVTNNVRDQGAFRLAEAIRLVHPTCGLSSCLEMMVMVESHILRRDTNSGYATYHVRLRS
jgi:hypothetical protein